MPQPSKLKVLCPSCGADIYDAVVAYLSGGGDADMHCPHCRTQICTQALTNTRALVSFYELPEESFEELLHENFRPSPIH